ncbi:MAG TPA: 2-oxoacid:acceptor oxidoreductase family protein, partial [Flavobacteriaceae bacterium]|nr:2-oxoacid:acceptor oxidoreductase family protein [Flavobacteriaceae bacterium]
YSDLIPKGKADIIISVEPMELLRYLPYLKKDGLLVTDANPFVNIKNYPELETLYKEIKSRPNAILVDAMKIAKDLGNSRATNIVLLGAASSLLPLSEESIKKAIATLFERKGERIVTKNLEAFEKGKEIATEKAL